MDKETVFADGLIVKSPHENAPDFIKYELSIKVSEFMQFIQKHQEKDWVNIDLKISKAGKPYAQLNTFKPEKKAPEVEAEGIPF